MSGYGQRGQTAAEYMGLLLVVAAIIGVLAGSGISGSLARGVERGICTVSGQEGCGSGRVGDAKASTPPDRDADGVSDAREKQLGSDPGRADTDDDGLSDGEERAVGADPTKADTDDDLLPDAEEARSGGRLKPGDADSDDDGLTDAEEVAAETDPSSADGDGEFGVRSDGLTDAQEIERGTDPNAYDTDQDGLGDGYEVDRGTDPLEDERNLLQKGFDTLVLDDPLSAILPGGGAGKGAKKVIDDLLGGGKKQGARQIGGAETVKDAAKVRKDRVAAVRERIRKAKERLRDERGSVRGPGLPKPLGEGSVRPPGGLQPQDLLDRAATEIDDAGGELSRAGRSYDKKTGGRGASSFGARGGTKAQKNAAGEQALREILEDRASSVRPFGGPPGKAGFDVVGSDGRTARFREDGTFVGFREPER